MVIAVASWELSLPGCASLKQKRMVLRSLKERIRKRFNVSISETSHQDLWSRAELSAAVVGSDRQFTDSVLDRVDQLVEGETRAVITRSDRWFA